MTADHSSSRAQQKVVSPVFLLVTFATFAYFLAVGTILPILPRFVEGPLDHGNVAVGMATGAFAVTAVMLRPLVGRLSDRRGRAILIIGGGLSVGLSVAGYALTVSLPALLFLRLVTGVGEAGFYVGVASVVNDLAPEERRGEALSYFSLALFGGLALGPVVGESLLEATGFDAVWLAAGASAFIAGVVGFVVPDTRPPGTAEGAPTRIIHPAALRPGTILATHIWALATFSSFVPLYALSLGMSGSRYVFAVHSAIILSIRSLGARLPDTLGPRRAARAALSCTGAGLTVMGLWRQPAGLFAGAAIFSIGHALAFPALMTLAIRGARPAERGAVVGTFTAFFDAAFGIGALVAGVLADALGYRGSFIGAGVVALVGFSLTFGLVRGTGRREPEQIAPEAAAAR